MYLEARISLLGIKIPTAGALAAGSARTLPHDS